MTSKPNPNTGGRKYTIEQVRHPSSKIRRDKMRDLKICINASYVMDPTKSQPVRRMGMVEHGPPVRGGKCKRCCDVHARSQKPYVSKFYYEPTTNAFAR